jgi:hypothetical protein
LGRAAADSRWIIRRQINVYNEMAGAAEVLEANCELHLCFSQNEYTVFNY